MGRLDCSALIIDDVESSRDMANFFVLHSGWLSSLVADSDLALKMLMEKEFDLLILDWRMPELNGKDTLIKADRLLMERDPVGRKIPVVIYTGSELSLLEIPKCHRLVVKGVVSKKGSPFNQSKSFDKVLKEISNQKTKEMRAIAMANQ